ncbi:hypothetical protein ACFX1S_040116 [Malus domestica]
MFSSSSSETSVAAAARIFLHRVPILGLFLALRVPILGLFLALWVFVIINSLRQKKHHGLPVWPVFSMFLSLSLALLQTKPYELLSEVLCHQNETIRFKGPCCSSLFGAITFDPRIFSADRDKWQRQRNTAGFEFHSAKFQKLTVDSLFELVHARLFPVLEDSIKHLAPIDLQDVLMRLTFDNVCMITFGVDPGCLQPGLPKIPFAQAFEEATEGTLIRFCGPMCLWKAMTYFKLGAERKLQMSII